MDKFALVMGLLASITASQISKLINEINYAKWIHERWAEYIEEHPEYKDIAGDKRWHERWIKIYEKTIKCLELLLRIKRMIEELQGYTILAYRERA